MREHTYFVIGPLMVRKVNGYLECTLALYVVGPVTLTMWAMERAT